MKKETQFLLGVCAGFLVARAAINLYVYRETKRMLNTLSDTLRKEAELWDR